MRIKVSRSKNSISYFVIKDVYRDNKRTTKVVESLGNHEEILENHPGVDPYTWSKEYAKRGSSLFDIGSENKSQNSSRFDMDPLRV